MCCLNQHRVVNYVFHCFNDKSKVVLSPCWKRIVCNILPLVFCYVTYVNYRTVIVPHLRSVSGITASKTWMHLIESESRSNSPWTSRNKEQIEKCHWIGMEDRCITIQELTAHDMRMINGFHFKRAFVNANVIDSKLFIEEQKQHS